MLRSKLAMVLLTVVCSFPALAQAQSIPQFTISTIAGNGLAGYSGDGGPALKASFNDPHGIAVDVAGNLYVADKSNSRVRKVTPSGLITTFAGTGVAGYGGDGGAAISAQLNRPERVFIDTDGNLYIADILNYDVRKVSASGIITTVAGSGQQGYCGNNGPAIAACMRGPEDVISDTNGNLFIADFDVVWKVNASGIITTVAGNAVQGYSGDGGLATAASFNSIQGVAVNSNGELFIADQGNYRIRKVSGGIVTTVVGTGVNGFAGDGGPASGAQIGLLGDIRFDASGNLLIPDSSNCRVRALLSNGNLYTVAGNGNCAYSSGSGPATTAGFTPTSVATGSSGSVYFSDTPNERVGLLTPVSQFPAITGVVTASAFGGFTSISPGSWIEIYGSNLASDTRSWAGTDFNGINAPTSLDGTTVTIGGKAAFIDYISPGQVNALVASNTPTGPQQLTVTTAAGTSAAFNITVNLTEPGLLSPASFTINGTSYAAAFFSDGTSVLPVGAIPGVTSRPAKPGDTIILYGVGFGPVSPSISAGQLVQQSNMLASSFQILVGGMPATVAYAGLAPSFTGLYQFDVTVPSVATGAQPLTFTLGGNPGAQKLNIAVGN